MLMGALLFGVYTTKDKAAPWATSGLMLALALLYWRVGRHAMRLAACSLIHRSRGLQRSSF